MKISPPHAPTAHDHRFRGARATRASRAREVPLAVRRRRRRRRPPPNARAPRHARAHSHAYARPARPRVASSPARAPTEGHAHPSSRAPITAPVVVRGRSRSSRDAAAHVPLVTIARVLRPRQPRLARPLARPLARRLASVRQTPGTTTARAGATKSPRVALSRRARDAASASPRRDARGGYLPY